MFGGGEEYFREPDPIDHETLKKFARFCAKLRKLEKPSSRAIDETCNLAKEVGSLREAAELVVGTVFRHIKSCTGNKQLCCWYVLDKLCKENRDTYAFIAQSYIIEIACDYIPFEDNTLVGKYEKLIEHWDCVFPPNVIDQIWKGKKERLWAVSHPDDVKRAREEEEEEWKREELRQQDEEGLDNFGQPCMDYLQGRCLWGDQCKQLHPPGLEGSLPLECRLGDWKCGGCGSINRHFRRRCGNCIREKPQYRKLQEKNPEDELLSHPDEVVLEIERQQFGYNPLDEADAVAHWKRRLDSVSTEQFKKERSAAYRTRILKRSPSNSFEVQVSKQINFTSVNIGSEDVFLKSSADQPAAKKSRVESLVPQGLSHSEGLAYLARMVVERGAQDALVPQCLFQMVCLLKEMAGAGATLNSIQNDAFFSACKLVFSAWNTSRQSAPWAGLFFADTKQSLAKIGLPPNVLEQILVMVSIVETAKR